MAFSKPTQPKQNLVTKRSHIRDLKRPIQIDESDSDSDLEPDDGELDVSSPEELETGGDGGRIQQSSESEDSNEEYPTDEEVIEEDEGEAVKRKLANVSFGALAKAQDALNGSGSGRKRKRGSENNAESDSKLQALRERLRELRAARGGMTEDGRAEKKSKKDDRTVQEQKQNQDSFFVEREEENDSSSDPATESVSDDGNAEEESLSQKKSRSSKHAPAEQSSRHAVSRKRAIVAPPKPTVGDPRFERFTGRLNPSSVAQKYAFIDQYRASELSNLRTALKNAVKTRMPDDESAKLKRSIASLESQQRVRDEKEREKSIVKEHRRKEQQARKAGKKPFYLKKSEVRKQALTQRFEGMKSQERDRAIERRRKKVAARERRRMPQARRA